MNIIVTLSLVFIVLHISLLVYSLNKKDRFGANKKDILGAIINCIALIIWILDLIKYFNN